MIILEKMNLNYYLIDVFSTEKDKRDSLTVVVLDEDLSTTRFEAISKELGNTSISFVQYSEELNILNIRSFSKVGIEIKDVDYHFLGAVHTVLSDEDEFKPHFDAIPKVFFHDKEMDVSVKGRIGFKTIQSEKMQLDSIITVYLGEDNVLEMRSIIKEKRTLFT